MSRHLQRDIEAINQELLGISSMVEDMIDKATQALNERKFELADNCIRLKTRYATESSHLVVNIHFR